ncbi:diacylglycerol kinase family protein [Paenibacillus sp.]|uniref:diacylglycerol kinase family protein n=1 Tax=Paenibacillus sp. TaxID=58172 RepID=UPI002810F74B|nr:diacylglycerol kinase family protein [Paenibacillus sp.]
MKKKKGIGLRYAAWGWWHALRHERNMRIHAVAAAAAVAVGAYARLDRDDWLWVALSIALVWSAECVNTAMERVVDLVVGTEREPLAKAAKDTAAAAVLVLTAFSLVVAGTVLVPAALARLVE